MTVRRKQRYRSAEEESKRSILAHMEHLRSIGEALTRAVDTYMAGHNASQAESEHGWREDLAMNLGDAVDEFHRSLAEVPRRTLDTYLAGEDEDQAGAGSERSGPRAEPPGPEPKTSAPG